MAALDAAAKEALAVAGLSQAAYARYWFTDGEWHGDSCGCTDDRCKGYHHGFGDECQCRDVCIREAWDAIRIPGSIHRA